MKTEFGKFIFLFPILFSSYIIAQSKTDVFSITRLNINIVINKSTDELNRLWNAKPGFEASVEMPFYYGTIVGGIRFLPYRAKGNIHHNINAAFYFAGWGQKLNLPVSLEWYNGFKVGAFEMTFDGDSLSDEQHHKLQLSAGVSSRMSLYIIHNFMLFVAVDYAAVFTHKRIELFLLSGGISYSFATPIWLKNFLK